MNFNKHDVAIVILKERVEEIENELSIIEVMLEEDEWINRSTLNYDSVEQREKDEQRMKNNTLTLQERLQAKKKDIENSIRMLENDFSEL